MHEWARAKWLVAASQATLAVGLATCYVLLPQFLSQEGGVSNYGVHFKTVLPYTVAFGGCGLLLALAARALGTPAARRLGRGLNVLAALVLLVLLTTYPYTLNSFFTDAHQLAAIVLFAFQELFGGWLALGERRGNVNIALWLAQTAGGLAAFITLIGAAHLLFVSQLLTGAAFALLLVRSV